MRINNSKSKAKPFLKWVGGKTQLLDELEGRLPENIKKSGIIEKYIEPFVGGGALFFYLKSRYTMKKAYLIDNNKDLIVAYKVIQNNPEELTKSLQDIQYRYLKNDAEGRAKFYYRVRIKYNKQKINFDYSSYHDEWIKRGTYLIFLNKTCFNGLFRLNSKGEFNVPHGKYKNPKIADKENILEVNRALKNTVIFCADFTQCKKYVGKGTLLYFDPPYRPLSATSNFTGYTKDGFNDNDQARLAKLYRELSAKGAYLVLSNSDPTNENKEDLFFEEIYSGFNIHRVLANRMINCNGERRGQIKELLIANY